MVISLRTEKINAILDKYNTMVHNNNAPKIQYELWRLLKALSSENQLIDIQISALMSCWEDTSYDLKIRDKIFENVPYDFISLLHSAQEQTW